MSNFIDAFDMAIELIVIASLVTITLGLVYLGIRGNNSSTESLQYYYNKDMYFDYNGSVIDGSTAIILAEDANKHGNILVKFYTKSCPDGFITIEGVKDIRSMHYIDPSADYVCNAIQDRSNNTIALQIIEVGTNLLGISEANLNTELRKLETANVILSQSITEADNRTNILRNEHINGVTIDTSAQMAYQEYVFYDKMSEFYRRWREHL